MIIKNKANLNHFLEEILMPIDSMDFERSFSYITELINKKNDMNLISGSNLYDDVYKDIENEGDSYLEGLFISTKGFAAIDDIQEEQHSILENNIDEFLDNLSPQWMDRFIRSIELNNEVLKSKDTSWLNKEWLKQALIVGRAKDVVSHAVDCKNWSLILKLQLLKKDLIDKGIFRKLETSLNPLSPHHLIQIWEDKKEKLSFSENITYLNIIEKFIDNENEWNQKNIFKYMNNEYKNGHKAIQKILKDNALRYLSFYRSNTPFESHKDNSFIKNNNENNKTTTYKNSILLSRIIKHYGMTLKDINWLNGDSIITWHKSLLNKNNNMHFLLAFLSQFDDETSKSFKHIGIIKEQKELLENKFNDSYKELVETMGNENLRVLCDFLKDKEKENQKNYMNISFVFDLLKQAIKNNRLRKIEHFDEKLDKLAMHINLIDKNHLSNKPSKKLKRKM